jgi:hypothetical protein
MRQAQEEPLPEGYMGSENANFSPVFIPLERLPARLRSQAAWRIDPLRVIISAL